MFGELDLATAPRLKQALEQAVEVPGELVIDMRACSFIDSMGIAVLAGTASRLREDGRHLVIRGVGRRVMRTFEIAGLAGGPAITIEQEPQPSGSQ